MRAAPVVRAVRGGVTRRRLQTIVIGLVVLVATAAATLGLGLLIDSNGPFRHAFTAQHGADLIVMVDAGKATKTQLAATARVPGVTRAVGPFGEAGITPWVSYRGGVTLPPATLAGRASPGGPLDDLTLDAGRWARRPGEVVLSRDFFGILSPAQMIGQQITVTSAAGLRADRRGSGQVDHRFRERLGRAS